MREGLRSQKVSANHETEKVPQREVVFKNEDDTEQTGTNLDGDEGPHLISPGLAPERESLGLIIDEETRDTATEECELDGDMGTTSNVGLTANRKRKSLCSGEDTKDDGVLKKLKEDNVHNAVQIEGRVLRSRFVVKRGDDKKSEIGETEGVLVGKSGGNGCFEKEMFKAEKEEFDRYVDNECKERVEMQKEDTDRSVCVLTKNLEQKPGRSPKEHKEEFFQLVDDLNNQVKRKPGRPPKVCDRFVGDRYEKMVEIPKEDGDRSVCVLKKNLKPKLGRPPNEQKEECNLLFGDLNNQVKRKPGRPPKVCDGFIGEGYKKRVNVEKEDCDRSVCGLKLKRKRGRPPKEHKEEVNLSVRGLKKKWKRKPGRPPKVEASNGLMKLVDDKKLKLGDCRKRKKRLSTRDSVEQNGATDITLSERRPFRKEVQSNSFSTAKMDKSGKVMKTKSNEAALVFRSDSANATSFVKRGRSKSAAKQLVREQIMKLLFAAGWTVDYRPRFKKEYNDAVYVSPDRKTHWSITLAYNRLKMHWEAGSGEGEVYMPGFQFTPIAEKEFCTLTKVMIKKREDKKKLKQKGGNTIDGVSKKRMGKEKLHSVTNTRNSLKGKVKRKLLKLEKDNLNLPSLKGMPNLVKDHKRQKTQNRKRCALLVRNAKEKVDSDVDGYLPYNGKRTVLSWMIDLGLIPLNGKVQFKNGRKKHAILEGRITRDGINCDCCSEVVTISKFEAHAGSKIYEPLKNIYVEETSLLQCELDSWNKQDESERKDFHFIDVSGDDPNDDTCGICGDGGDLICCDSCPSTFHQGCLDIKKFPSGDWNCVYCCCKFCGLVGGSTYTRDEIDDVAKSPLLKCRLCEEKYHDFCIQMNGSVNHESRDPSFCGNRCQEVFERFKGLLGVKHEIEEGFSWTLIHRSSVGVEASQINSQLVECNSKLAVALLVMDECFLPVIDHRSGINLIRSILYNCGSNFNRLNYSGFFTAILERGDEIIAAASIRIHGNQLAEMPFIGTRYMYRRQGMCRRLLSGIESVLSSLNVEILVIPAISELRETWTSVFGFEPLEVTNKQKMNNMNLLVFPGVDMLQKRILKHECDVENMIQVEGKINDKPVSTESGSQLPDALLNDDTTSETVNFHNGATDQVKFRVIHDNLEEKNNDALKQGKEISEFQNADSGCVILPKDAKVTELISELNQCSISGEGRKSCMVSYPFVSLESTENFHCEAKDETVTNNLNCVEDSLHCLSESVSNESKNMGFIDESKASDDFFCHASESRMPLSHDAAKLVHHDSQKLQVTGCVCDSREQMPNTCGLRTDLVLAQHLSISLKEFSPASATCSGSPFTSVRLGEENISNGLAVDCDIKPLSQENEQYAAEAELCDTKMPDIGTCTSSGVIPSTWGTEVNVTSADERKEASTVAGTIPNPANVDLFPSRLQMENKFPEQSQPDSR